MEDIDGTMTTARPKYLRCTMARIESFSLCNPLEQPSLELTHFCRCRKKESFSRGCEGGVTKCPVFWPPSYSHIALSSPVGVHATQVPLGVHVRLSESDSNSLCAPALLPHPPEAVLALLLAAGPVLVLFGMKPGIGNHKRCCPYQYIGAANALVLTNR